MQKVVEERDQKIEDFKTWAREQCRTLKLIPDLVDLVMGVVYDNPVPQRPGDAQRRPMSRIENDDIIAEAATRNREIWECGQSLIQIKKKIAMAANVRIDQINHKTGEITQDEEEAAVFNLDIDD